MSQNPVPDFHYYASTPYGWGTAPTRDEAVKVAHRPTPAGVINRMVEDHEGLELHSCKVHAPLGTKYDINWYLPQEVETSEYETHRIVTAKGAFITLTKPHTLRNRLHRIKAEAEAAGYAMSWWTPSEITEGVAWSDDIGLSADQLDAKYNPVGDGEHPYFRRKDWRTAVASEDTINGYWGWVVSQIDSYDGDDEEVDPDTKNWVPED